MLLISIYPLVLGIEWSLGIWDDVCHNRLSSTINYRMNLTLMFPRNTFYIHCWFDP